jgi:hypothetical protein
LNRQYGPRACSGCIKKSRRRIKLLPPDISYKEEEEEREEQIIIIFYPMGLMIRDKTAIKADGVTPYAMMGYKYVENDLVHLTTAEPYTSRRMLRPEINALKSWLDTDDYDGVFDGIADGLYVHRARSMEGRLHVRDKLTGKYVYTYVPEEFFRRI